MNEVSQTQRAAQVVVGAASSQGAAKQTAQLTPTHSDVRAGNNLPPVAETSVGTIQENTGKAVPAAVDHQEKLESAVASLNDFIQSVQRDLNFSIDEELDKTIIKVIDSVSGDLIRQIPEDVFLELARNLIDRGELQLIDELS